jgi:hypothetical protein
MFGKNNQHSKSGMHAKDGCFNCGATGHMVKDCWSKGGGKEGQCPENYSGKGKGKWKGKRQGNKANQGTHQNSEDSNHHASFMAVHSDKPHFDSRLSRDAWLADSGCTVHIANKREVFSDYTPLEGETINGLGDNSVKAHGRGTVMLESIINGEWQTVSLHNTLYAPTATNNLLSITRIDEAGGSAAFKNGKANIYSKSGKLFLEGKKVNRLYWLDAKTVLPGNHANVGNLEGNNPNSWMAWHRRYGHVSDSTLELLVRNESVEGFTIDPSTKSDADLCEACIEAKMHRKPFPHEALHRSENPGEGTHSDLWGPARTRSTEGNYYYISFTDDKSRRITVLFMKNKNEAETKVLDHVGWLERQYGYKLKWIRVDEGGEYLSNSN